jgi:presenilin-like A22 family membrane protease
MQFSTFKLSGFLRVLVPFLATQLLGVYVAYRFLPDIIHTKPISWGGFSVYDLIFTVVFAAVFIYVATRFQRIGSIFYKVFLTILIFSGVQTVLGIWLAPTTAILAAGLSVILFWFFQNVIVQNVAMILTIGGIGAVLGISFVPTTVLIILVLFSFYDIIAVYKTGHMIKLAESMIRSRAIFGFIIPDSVRGLKTQVSDVAPGEQFMILGSGDVIFPLLLSASLVRISIVQALAVSIFSALGLLLMFILFSTQKVRRPMAALPPIAGMSILGYLLVSLLLK